MRLYRPFSGGGGDGLRNYVIFQLAAVGTKYSLIPRPSIMQREGLVLTACACARFSVYFAVKLSVNVQAHNIRTYLDSAECSRMHMQSIPGLPSA